MKWYRKYNKDTTEYMGDIRTFKGEPLHPAADILYIEYTPPPMPIPKVADGVYWVEDEDGDSGIRCRYKGKWTDPDFNEADDPEQIIKKLY